MFTTILRAFCAVAVALWFGGCGDAGAAPEPPDHHDHDHGHDDGGTKGKAAEAHEHDHDHAEDHKGHDHGEEKHDHVNEVYLTPEAMKRYGITVGKVSRRTLAATLTAAGRVAFNAEAVAHAGSPVAGRVVELKARPGDVVKEGDVLVVVESPEFGEAQGELVQRKIAAEVAAAAAQAAKAVYDRGQALRQQSDGISVADLQRREAEWVAAAGAARTAEAALLGARNKLRLLGFDDATVDALAESGSIDPRLAVRSPRAGTVVERGVALGERVTPERDALAIVADLSTVWVLADVPEARLGDVAVGEVARVRLASSVDKVVEATVSHVAASLDPETRTGRVRVEVPNESGAIRPGMSARVEISAATPASPAALAVPEGAVQTVGGKPAVFVPVAGEPNTFQVRPVTVGRAVGGMVPVLSGLKEGDAVVTDGTFVLKAELGKGEASHGHDH